MREPKAYMTMIRQSTEMSVIVAYVAQSSASVPASPKRSTLRSEASSGSGRPMTDWKVAPKRSEATTADVCSASHLRRTRSGGTRGLGGARRVARTASCALRVATPHSHVSRMSLAATRSNASSSAWSMSPVPSESMRAIVSSVSTPDGPPSRASST